jgi:hypothetical protein
LKLFLKKKKNEPQTPVFNENYKNEDVFDEFVDIKTKESPKIEKIENFKKEVLKNVLNEESEGDYLVSPFAVLNGHESQITAIKEITYDFCPSICCGKI